MTESTNIATIFWSENLKQGYRFCAQPTGKVCSVSIVVRASEFTKKVAPGTSLALLYVCTNIHNDCVWSGFRNDEDSNHRLLNTIHFLINSRITNKQQPYLSAQF